jgi:hypothetical protein
VASLIRISHYNQAGQKVKKAGNCNDLQGSNQPVGLPVRALAARIGGGPRLVVWAPSPARGLTEAFENADSSCDMDGEERRQTERVMLAIPVRVLAFRGSGGDFAEDTFTVQVNQAGARIALKHRVAPGDDLRIINLQNLAEADFRVIGPTRLDRGQVAEWGVECLESSRNIWGIDFPAPISSEDSRAGALLACQGCGREVLSVLSLMEAETLEAAGSLNRLCDRCGELSIWIYADITRRPQAQPGHPESALPPEPPPAYEAGGIERRAHKRLPIRLPVAVRNHKGEQEISKTENVSKGGFAVCLGLMLAVGEVVRVVCPYTEDAHNMEQKAEVRRRADFTPGERWLYGMRYVR